MTYEQSRLYIAEEELNFLNDLLVNLSTRSTSMTPLMKAAEEVKSHKLIEIETLKKRIEHIEQHKGL